jgi:hypothetical protein
LARTLASDVDVAVIRIAHEAVTAVVQLPIQLVGHLAQGPEVIDVPVEHIEPTHLG